MLSSEELEKWLLSLGFPEVAAAVRRLGTDVTSLCSSQTIRSRGVCGRSVPHLGHAGWEELGVSSAVDRAKIMGLLPR